MPVISGPTTEPAKESKVGWLLKKLTLDLPRTCRQAGFLVRFGREPYRLAKEVIGSGQALQRKWEFVPLLGMVRNLRPAVVLEIGTYRGGTLYCWTRLATDDAL